MRLARRLIITLIVLFALFVAANQIAQNIAGSKVAEQAQKSFHTAHKPKVTIGSFPFLLDLLNGKITTLTVEGSDAKEQDLNIARLRISLKGIHAKIADITSARPVEVDSGLAEADVTAAEVDRYVHDRNPHVHVTLTDTGVVATGSVAGAGTGRAEGTPKLVGRVLSFTPDRVSVNGQPLHGAALAAAQRELSFEVDVPELPGGVRITSIDYAPAEVRLTAKLSHATIDLSRSPS